MTSEERNIENVKNKERMKLLRSKRQEKVDIRKLEHVKLEKRKAQQAKDKERKRQERLDKSFEHWKEDCEQDIERKKFGNEMEKEFQLISLKHRNRSSRNLRSGKMKLRENLKAKKGMRNFREEGRLRDHAYRGKTNSSELNDWKEFRENGDRHAEKLDKMRPDIVQILNKGVREEKERLRIQREREEENERIRKEKVEEDGGEWVYNSEYAEYYWVGEGEPTGAQDPEDWNMSEQEL